MVGEDAGTVCHNLSLSCHFIEYGGTFEFDLIKHEATRLIIVP